MIADKTYLVKLADELIAQNYGNVRDIDTMGEHFALLAKAASALRRLASSDGGVKGEPEPVKWPANLNPRTLDLVQRFALALAKKLRLAEEKYGHADGWLRDDWESECRDHLYQHLEKGDPRDVAAYCAFMWHHDWITCRPVITAPPADAGMREALKEARERLLNIWAGRCPGVGCEGDPVAFRDWATAYADAGVKSLDKALTAPGATTKSDGGCMADFSPDDPTNLKELMASKPVWSDPSSTRSDAELFERHTGLKLKITDATRSDVTVEELAEFLAPRAFDGNATERHRYCSPLQVDVVQDHARDKACALLDQFEIRRK